MALVSLPPRHTNVLLLVCTYSFLIVFKPSEPFLVAFMECDKFIPGHDVIHTIFPVWSYAYLALLPITSASAELVGLKTVVLAGVVGRLITLTLLLAPPTDGSILAMQLSQATVALGFAAHPALNAIMYRGLPREAYLQGAGYTASVGVVASFSSSLLGQVLLTSVHVELYELFVISAAFTTAALLFAVLLPSGSASSRPMAQPLLPPHGHHHHQPSSAGAINHGAHGGGGGGDAGASGGSNSASAGGTTAEGSNEAGEAPQRGCSAAAATDAASVAVASTVPGAATECTAPAAAAADDRESGGGLQQGQRLVVDTVNTLRHSGAAYYYVWLSVATSVHHLVVTYWQAAVPHGAHPLDHEGLLGNGTRCSHPAGASANGYTQALASLLGGCAALLPICGEACLRNSARFGRLREATLLVGPLALAGLLHLMSVVEVAASYDAAYVAFHVCFELMRVLCEAEGARCVAAFRTSAMPRFAAVSGLTTTLTLSLQVVLQLLFNNPRRLPLSAQFELLAALLLVLGAAYNAAALGRFLLCRRRGRAEGGEEGGDGVRRERAA